LLASRLAWPSSRATWRRQDDKLTINANNILEHDLMIPYPNQFRRDTHNALDKTLTLNGCGTSGSMFSRWFAIVALSRQELKAAMIVQYIVVLLDSLRFDLSLFDLGRYHISYVNVDVHTGSSLIRILCVFVQN
jgi:hypothetical protein